MMNQSKLDPQIKQTVVDALIKVVENAPTKVLVNSPFGSYPYITPSGSPYNPLPRSLNPYEVTQSRFNIWINYVNSTLQIVSQYVDSSLSFSVQSNIQMIASQSGLDYATKTNNICQIILDFARKILYL